MEDYKYYCPHCEWFWVGDELYCVECLQPLESEPDPNEGPYDTLEEKALAQDE